MNVEWIDRGIKCKATQYPHGAWCGYITVDPTIKTPPRESEFHDKWDFIDVHGGVTYSDANGIIGFDCCHAWDYIPQYQVGEEDDYKDLDYVKTEIKKMVDQYLHWRDHGKLLAVSEEEGLEGPEK